MKTSRLEYDNVLIAPGRNSKLTKDNINKSHPGYNGVMT